MIDFKDFNEKFDLIGFAQANGSIKKVVSSSYYIGSCPICGGNDRFQIKIEINCWICRNCSNVKYQSAIDLLVKFYNCTPSEAVMKYKDQIINKDYLISNKDYPIVNKPEPEFEDPLYMSQWSSAATRLIDYSVRQFEEDKDEHHQLFMLRNLLKSTIVEAQVGYHPKKATYRANVFGLSESVTIDIGYLFPIRNYAGTIVGIQQVKPEKPKEDRYKIVVGSSIDGLMYSKDFLVSAGNKRVIVAVEGAINYLSGIQDINGKNISGREVHVIGINSTTSKITKTLSKVVTEDDVILFMLDYDNAGLNMWDKLTKCDLPCKIRRLDQPKVDLSDMLIAKLPPTIEEWLDHEIEKIRKISKKVQNV